MPAMRTTLAFAFALLLCGAPALVHADAIPGCPPGQHVVMNPVPPGSMHHGGGHCEPDAPPPPNTRHHPRPHPTPPNPPPDNPPSPPSSPGGGGSRS